MPIEQRVVATPPAKIGARIGGGSTPTKAAEPEPQEKKKPRGRLVVLAAILALVVVAAALFATGHLPGLSSAAAQPGSTAAAKPTPTPKPGAVVKVDPISLNLKGGHYLRLGLALQLTAKAKDTPDTSRALDLAIALWSGRSVEEVADPATRDALKDQLTKELGKAYEGEVMGVYLTTYVTQ